MTKRRSLRSPMAIRLLDVVVLTGDHPEHELRSGDLGTVVEVLEPNGLEVEFVTASGRTNAVATLRFDDVRALRDSDVLAVRSLLERPT